MSPFIELGVGFNPELNARDNVRVNATMLGLSRRELADKFDEMIEFAELGRFVDLKLKNFSSGMIMRLAYSVAIQVPFDILLLDEVLAVGDQSFQEKCFATLDEIRAAGQDDPLRQPRPRLGAADLRSGASSSTTASSQALGPAAEVVDSYEDLGVHA